MSAPDDLGEGLPPLPERPAWPVYGLAGTFGGPRWLNVWNRLGVEGAIDPLYEVSLGHGELEQSPVLVVTTHVKLAVPFDGGYVSSGADTAARAALLGMLVLAFPTGEQGDPGPEFLREAQRAGQVSGQLEGPEWADTTAEVDGAATPFRIRSRNGAWVAVADLGPVAVGAYGLGIELGDHDLTVVNNSLDAYGTLT